MAGEAAHRGSARRELVMHAARRRATATASAARHWRADALERLRVSVERHLGDLVEQIDRHGGYRVAGERLAAAVALQMLLRVLVGVLRLEHLAARGLLLLLLPHPSSTCAATARLTPATPRAGKHGCVRLRK